ncbi:TIGR02677 family protein [Methylococcus sp. Mc7]|uniref:TIGR02677 family protein n=1 Tax=Methylococcus sp. Mc7 TaxID=2860258 RepID=UPI001C527F49|nr:TIGR02677 family protein [Methylococcus sp. Mc7]QXP85026.1 TIGR02677 family protein [Methylococcus sp. Mc7]
MNTSPCHRELFRHVSADKAAFYRAIMEVFAAAKRQFRPYLRPDEVLREAAWPSDPPALEEVRAALAQLVEWGNLESQPDTARVASIDDFYLARFLYRLSHGGEAVESALAAFAQALGRRGELQSVALEDIHARLEALIALAADSAPDDAKVHEVLRDLVRVFEDLAENAQAFMAGIVRSVEIQQAEAQAVVGFKKRLIDYLERFIGDLVSRSGAIAQRIKALDSRIDALLWQAANREARDIAPGDVREQAGALQARVDAWRERWRGLRLWFVSDGHGPAQAEALRAKARAAIPQLLAAIAAVNERRSGRSDRSADFRVLARWFADCADDGQAHRLARAAFALNPARHLSLLAATEVPATTPWADAPAVAIHPRLREYGTAAVRGTAPKVTNRDAGRAALARLAAAEHRQVEAARARLATGTVCRLSELGRLDPHEFDLFLAVLGEALASQSSPDETVARTTSDGLLHIRLEPLGEASQAVIETDLGVFSGRDHRITITPEGNAGPSHVSSPSSGDGLRQVSNA